jgi:hypothetical protein
VATTTWSAVIVPRSVRISNVPSERPRSRVAETPSINGGSNEATNFSRYCTISSRRMKPSGSSPGYGKPGSRHCQFGVTRQKESQRRLRHSEATLSRSSTTWSMPRCVSHQLIERPAWPPPITTTERWTVSVPSGQLVDIGGVPDMCRLAQGCGVRSMPFSEAMRDCRTVAPGNHLCCVLLPASYEGLIRGGGAGRRPAGAGRG